MVEKFSKEFIEFFLDLFCCSNTLSLLLVDVKIKVFACFPPKILLIDLTVDLILRSLRLRYNLEYSSGVQTLNNVF